MSCQVAGWKDWLLGSESLQVVCNVYEEHNTQSHWKAAQLVKCQEAWWPAVYAGCCKVVIYCLP